MDVIYAHDGKEAITAYENTFPQKSFRCDNHGPCWSRGVGRKEANIEIIKMDPDV